MRIAALALALAGCAQFGVPEVPPELRAEARGEGELYIAYHPWSVLGFGHSGVIVADPGGGGYLRYDQYASSEIELEQRRSQDKAHFWEGFTARLPPLVGLTREFVTRRAAAEAELLLGSEELFIPVPLGSGNARSVHAAGEARHQEAARLDAPGARRYYLLSNNCQHFVRDLLRAAGMPDPPYFPKHHVERLISENRERAKNRGGQSR